MTPQSAIPRGPRKGTPNAKSSPNRYESKHSKDPPKATTKTKSIQIDVCFVFCIHIYLYIYTSVLNCLKCIPKVLGWSPHPMCFLYRNLGVARPLSLKNKCFYWICTNARKMGGCGWLPLISCVGSRCRALRKDGVLNETSSEPTKQGNKQPKQSNTS